MAATRQVPGLARLAARPAVAARMPSIARLALGKRWAELGQLLRGCCSPAELASIRDAFSIPALRWYGRHQLTAWQRQELSRAHLAHLALPAGAVRA